MFKMVSSNVTKQLTIISPKKKELTDVFGMMCKDGRSIKGYVLSGYWNDVGTPDDLAKTHELIVI